MIEEGQLLRDPEKDTNRLEAFSDGVFAIAITLLILDLHVPDLSSPNLSTALLQALERQWPSYLSLTFSFITILVMWINHHRLFKAVKQARPLLLFANGFLLLLVTVVPFPTALVGMYLRTPAASLVCAIYASFFVFINLAFNLLWWVITKQQARRQTRLVQSKISTISTVLGFPSYVIAAFIAFWNPYVSLGISLFLWIVWAFIASDQYPYETASSELERT